MRFFLGLGLAVLAAAVPCGGQHLRAKSANIHSVQLEWDGGTGPWTVERKAEAPGTFQKIGSAAAANFEDAKIEPYATYRYRVSGATGAKPSNEIVVGPPPAGVMAASLAPSAGEPGNYGANSAVTRDENGDPAIAFVVLDPNGDGNMSDTEVRFVRWNRATHLWDKPVKVTTVGDLPLRNVEPVSVACDAKSGTFVIATPIINSGVNIAVSKDRGYTWTITQVDATEHGASSTVVALSGDTIHLFANIDVVGMRYYTGALADAPSKWKSETMSKPDGWTPQSSVNIALVLDQQNQPVVAWYEIKDEGEGRRFVTRRIGSAPVVAIQTSLGTDYPNLALTSGAGKLGLLVSNPLDANKSDLAMWYASSPEGSTWSKPVMIPVDGPRSTNAPEGLAIDSHGRVVAAFGSNSGSEGPKCGAPMVSRSPDGVEWTTCGIGASTGADFDVQSNTIHVLSGGDDSTFVTWQQTSDSKIGKGLLIWHGK